MGWRHVQGDLDTPASTGRSSFAEMVQEATLRRQLRALNLRDVAGHSQPWLDQGRISQAVAAMPLFHTNQLLVATSFDEARVGSVGAAFRHFAAWKTVVGTDGQGTEAEVAAGLAAGLAAALGAQTGKPAGQALSEQERLVAGLLRPANLLDVVRHFTLFMVTEGQTVKALCRYQQYRAVSRAVLRLRTGKTRLQDGEFDRRPWP